MDKFIIGIHGQGIPCKIMNEEKDYYQVEQWDYKDGVFKHFNIQKAYTEELGKFQRYKIVSESSIDSKLLYPNQYSPIINSSLVTINGVISIINFYTNNGKHGTEEKLDDFDLDTLKENVIRFSQENPKRALEILQEIYDGE